MFIGANGRRKTSLTTEDFCKAEEMVDMSSTLKYVGIM